MFTTDLSLTADAGTSEFYFTRSGANVEVFDNLPTPVEPAAPVATVPYSCLGAVTITGGGQATTVILDYSNGDLFPNGFTFDGQTVPTLSPNQLIVTGDAGANYTLGSGSLAISDGSTISDSVSFSSVGSLNLFNSGGTSNLEVASGSFTFNSDLGESGASVSMLVDSGASVQFGATQHLNSLNISSGASVQMLAAGGQVLDTNTLTVNGTLDLTDNDMIVNNPSGDTSMVDTLEEQVGQWVNANSSGGVIESSTAAADGMTIGIAPAADLALPLTSLDGQTVNSDALVARYTGAGDANLDGLVNSADVQVLLINYGHVAGITAPQWYNGDFNYDGLINSADSQPLLINYGTQFASSPIDVTVGTTYTVTLPTTTPTTGDAIDRTDINWGDGTNNSYATGTTTATHVYTQTGYVDLQMAAVYYDPSTGYGTYHAPAQSLVISNTGVTATPLALTASAATDVFNISSDGSGDTVITQNGTVVEDEPTADILSLSITGGAASVSIDFTNGDPLPASGIYTDAANLSLDGPHGSDPLVTTATAAYLGSDSIRYPSTTTLTDNLTSDGGIYAIAGITNLNDLAGDALAVTTGASVLVNGSVTFSSLTIDAGGTVRQVSQDTALGDVSIDAGSLTIDGPSANGDNGGVLDLGGGDLIVRQTDANVVETLLEAGYNSDAWDGGTTSGPNPAAIVSSVAEELPDGLATLAPGQVGSGGLDISTFDGRSVSSGDTVVALIYDNGAPYYISYDPSSAVDVPFLPQTPSGLQVNATSDGETLTLVQSGGTIYVYPNASETGTPVATVSAADFSTLIINGSSNTVINVDSSGGNPLPATIEVASGSVTFNQNIGSIDLVVEPNASASSTVEQDLNSTTVFPGSTLNFDDPSGGDTPAQLDDPVGAILNGIGNALTDANNNLRKAHLPYVNVKIGSDGKGGAIFQIFSWDF